MGRENKQQALVIISGVVAIVICRVVVAVVAWACDGGDGGHRVSVVALALVGGGVCVVTIRTTIKVAAAAAAAAAVKVRVVAFSVKSCQHHGLVGDPSDVESFSVLVRFFEISQRNVPVAGSRIWGLYAVIIS